MFQFPWFIGQKSPWIPVPDHKSDHHCLLSYFQQIQQQGTESNALSLLALPSAISASLSPGDHWNILLSFSQITHKKWAHKKWVMDEIKNKVRVNNYLVVYVEAIDRSVTQFELFDPYDSTDKTLDTSSLWEYVPECKRLLGCLNINQLSKVPDKSVAALPWASTIRRCFSLEFRLLQHFFFPLQC